MKNLMQDWYLEELEEAWEEEEYSYRNLKRQDREVQNKLAHKAFRKELRKTKARA
jgi:hypothetical protein